MDDVTEKDTTATTKTSAKGGLFAWISRLFRRKPRWTMFVIVEGGALHRHSLEQLGAYCRAVDAGEQPPRVVVLEASAFQGSEAPPHVRIIFVDPFSSPKLAKIVEIDVESQGQSVDIDALNAGISKLASTRSKFVDGEATLTVDGKAIARCADKRIRAATSTSTFTDE